MYFGPTSEQVVSKILDGEAIVIDLTTGIYYSMEGIAAKIWRELNSGSSRDDLLQNVGNKYPGQPDAQDDIKVFVSRLVTDGLLVETEAPSTQPDELETVDWPNDYATPVIQSFDDVAEMVALDPPLPELQRYVPDS